MIKTIWQWLDGNKTTFGLVILWIAERVPVGIPLFGIPWLDLKDVLTAIGGALVGTGVVHKVVKKSLTANTTE